MIELDNYEQQIILACKGWGKWSKSEGRYKAIRVVIAQYYGFDIEELYSDTTYHCLYSLFLKIYGDNKRMIEYFMESLFKDLPFGGNKSQINKEHIIKNFISIISEIYIIDSYGNKLFNELKENYDILNYGFVESEVLKND